MAHIQVLEGLPGILGLMATVRRALKLCVNWRKYCCGVRTL